MPAPRSGRRNGTTAVATMGPAKLRGAGVSTPAGLEPACSGMAPQARPGARPQARPSAQFTFPLYLFCSCHNALLR